MLKDITLTTLLFYLLYFFYWGYYSKYYLEYVINLQIKSSLVPISNNPNRFSINLKRKNHTDNTLGKVFLLNSVRRLQKLYVIYIDGVRSYKNLASGENRGVWNTMRYLMSFNMRICVKSHHMHNSAFLFVLLFLLRLLQQVLFRIRDIPANQIIISTYK